jgi:hypothetical protein
MRRTEPELERSETEAPGQFLSPIFFDVTATNCNAKTFLCFESRNPSISMIPTVATEIVVNPARTATNWRPPKRMAVNTANNPPGDRPSRTCNQ